MNLRKCPPHLIDDKADAECCYHGFNGNLRNSFEVMAWGGITTRSPAETCNDPAISMSRTDPLRTNDALKLLETIGGEPEGNRALNATAGASITLIWFAKPRGYHESSPNTHWLSTS